MHTATLTADFNLLKDLKQMVRLTVSTQESSVKQRLKRQTEEGVTSFW